MLDNVFSGLTKMAEGYERGARDIAGIFANDAELWIVFALAVGIELALITYRAMADKGSWLQEGVELAIVGVLVGGAVGSWDDVRTTIEKSDVYAGKILSGAESGLTAAAVNTIGAEIFPLLKAAVGWGNIQQQIAGLVNSGQANTAQPPAAPPAPPTR